MIGSIVLSALLALGISLAANFSTTVYLHRGLSHRALTFTAPVALVFRVMTWIMTGIRPRQWVAVHRKHHAFTDVEGDPHSPVLLGWKTVQLRNVEFYRETAADPEVLKRYARDLPVGRLDRMLFDHALPGLAIGMALLWLAVGPWALLVGPLHAVIYVMLSGAVNGIGHTFGRRTYDNTGTNLQWLAMLTWGEGLHNNHHAAPTSAKFSLDRGQYDPAWLFIRLGNRLGLLSIRHDTVKLKADQIAV